jgi:hypothetical protein
LLVLAMADRGAHAGGRAGPLRAGPLSGLMILH